MRLVEKARVVHGSVVNDDANYHLVASDNDTRVNERVRLYWPVDHLNSAVLVVHNI
jgi:predicted transposase YbfD/YdcC